MAGRKLTIEDYVGAILDRDEGIPYTRVLDRHRITPNQFCGAVKRKLHDLIQATRGEARRTLEAISSDAVRERELFNMGEEFIREQYDRVRAGTQRRFYEGTLKHPENVEHIVYYALASNNPQLASEDRREVVAGIKSLPSNLKGYLKSLGLGGSMAVFGRGKRDSPLAVLEVFDRVYMGRTGGASLFDLEQEEHLHEWGDNFCASRFYWQDQANVEKAIYHVLIEDNPQLASEDRREVVAGIKKLPRDLVNYFCSLGLGGLMMQAFEGRRRKSPLAVLEIFDRAYMKKTGNASLFDLEQEEHLHKWGDNFMAPLKYWRNPANVEEAAYHTLTENNFQLASEDREKVIEGIKKLPINLKDYFYGLGLKGLMMQAFEGRRRESPLAVLEVFDRIYMRRTGDASLFDLSQEEHLHEWGDNFQAPNSYWQNPANVEETVYHVLTENVPLLTSTDREKVIERIKNLPINLQVYFCGLGLKGLMKAFGDEKKGSPLAVLEVFDRVYQRETGDASLFDKAQDDCLEFDGQNRLVR